MEEQLVLNVISSISVIYILSVNVLTYEIIKLIEIINKAKKLSKLFKMIIAFISGIIIAIIMICTKTLTIDVAIYSFIISLLSWDYIFKHVVKKLNKDYKKWMKMI